MRKLTRSTALLFIFLFAAGNISNTSVPDKKYARATGLPVSDIHKMDISFQDTLPSKIEIPVPPPIKLPEAPKLELPKKAPNLLKMLGELFKFKKHANQNEKRRVAKYINELGLKDSIAATEYNAKLLIYALSDTMNQNIESLRAIINYIKNNELDLSNRQEDIETMQDQLSGKFSALDNFIRINKDKFASREVSDKDLNILASKIFPIIEVSTDINSLAEKMAKIKMLDNIRDSASIVRYSTDSLGRKNYYFVTTKNKTDVYGFYNHTAKNNLQTDKLGYLNTLVYNSLFINSQTGDIKYLNGWDTSTIVTLAQKANCKIALTFSIADQSGKHDFLNNNLSQATFVNTAIYLMKFRNASAINIAFNNILPSETANFTYFISKLYSKLKQKDSDFNLMITIPALSSGNNYSVIDLKDISDRIIIDFSQNYSTTAAPLASESNLTDVISYFIKAKVVPEKIVVCLPYKGAKWAINTGYGDQFIEYITYSTIRKNFMFPGYTNYLIDTLASVVMDSFNRYKMPVRRIFYDDESTLALKYALILNNKINGVAVNGIGDDYGYTGLWDELSYAFAEPDTVQVNSNSIAILKKNEDLNIWQRLYRKFTLYSYILQHPCEVCFENIADSTERKTINQYLLDLDVGADMKTANAELLEKHEDTYRSKFEFVNSQLTGFLGKSSLIILIVLILLGALYIYRVKNMADTWAWKKTVGRVLIGISVLFILFCFALIFSSNDVPLFGATTSGNSGYSKDYASLLSASDNSKSVESDYCIKDPESNCINMPFQTLLGIIIVGLLIGYLLTRFLILPLVKRDVIP